jgi:hypothetical protein
MRISAYHLGNMMLKFELQKGSSTVGLLTATLIYVGLLVYANQYAFKVDRVNTSASNASQLAEPVTLNTEADIDTVATATQDHEEAPVQTTVVQISTDQTTQTKLTNPEQALPEADVVKNDASMIPVVQPAVFQPVYPSRSNFDQRFGSAQTAGFNNSQRYNTDSRAYTYSNGRGNGRGKMDGDGEFNFSIKFKSRGRMDANSDFDTDMAAYQNAYQYSGYDMNSATNPYFAYNYYRY